MSPKHHVTGSIMSPEASRHRKYYVNAHSPVMLWPPLNILLAWGRFRNPHNPPDPIALSQEVTPGDLIGVCVGVCKAVWVPGP